MALRLQYFQVNTLGSYVMDAWQNQLQTEADPAGGKWFINGPNNGPGLLGGLVDELATDLVFHQEKMLLTRTPEVATTTTLDNRTGLLDSGATTTLTWTITSTVTATHTTSHSIKTGIARKVGFKGGLSAGGVEVGELSTETTISFEYSFSLTDSEANTKTDTKNYTQVIPLKVPQGKVYKVVVLGDRNAATIPYSAQIFLTGVSEANFANAVNKNTRWSADAGTICEWIKKHGSAGNDSMKFDRDPTSPQRGIASLNGTIKVNQAVNFTIYALDVTSSFNADPGATALIKQIKSGSTPAATVYTQPVQSTAPGNP